MLGLFKKKKRKIESWEFELIRNVINQIPIEYMYLIRQIDRGLQISAFINSDLKMPEFVGFSLNPELIDEFENRKEKGFRLIGIKVYDKISCQQLDYVIYVFEGILSGYSIHGKQKFNIDTSKVDVTHFRRVDIYNADYERIKKILNSKEIQLINPDEIYEVILNEKVYFHIQDLEDGDFIGIDENKGIFKITHDPFEIKKIDRSLKEIMDSR